MKLTSHKLLGILAIFYASTIYASDYPKTREEQKAEEIGSALGGEGIVFRPGHAKNESTKDTIKNTQSVAVNKYLWQASRDVLKFMPIATVDSANGLLVTDWYSTKNKPNYGFKVEVHINSDLITPEAIEVSVFERKLQNGQWYNEPASALLASQFEDQILRRARELFIQAQK